MQQLPLSIDLTGRRAVLIGSSAAAAAKARLLLGAGATVMWIPDRSGDQPFQSLSDAHATTAPFDAAALTPDVIRRSLHDAVLFVIATSRRDEDERISALLRADGRIVNVVDRPDLSTVTFPAIVDRGSVTVGISTGGASPLLAQRIRRVIEGILPNGIGRVADLASEFRQTVASHVSDSVERRRFWNRIIDGPVAAKAQAGQLAEARQDMIAALNTFEFDHSAAGGRVDIVGAGPGDPDLLTLKAHRLLSQADVILYDRLAGPGVLGLARRDAELIDVGKAPGDHRMGQKGINALMVARAQSGQRVVRLKGGDPNTFGRGGEELEYLRDHGIDATVVPGITSAAGCAAAAGFPLTHRDHASQVVFVTGHAKDGGAETDWSGLATGERTIVVYMGLARVRDIVSRLVSAGMSPFTPAAIVDRGTWADQRIFRGVLSDLPLMVDQETIQGPALLVIGSVTTLADAPQWRSHLQQTAS